MMYLTKEDRLLPLTSLTNARELGGYETQEGSYTKTHRYIRCATSKTVSSKDQEYLINYGLNCVLDLRGTNEVNQIAHPLKNLPNVEYIHLDLFKNVQVEKAIDEFKDLGELYCFMIDHLQENIKAVFNIFYTHQDACILFSCSQGKDRTGVIAALLMDLAGCHMYDIIKDYTESYENNQEIIDEIIEVIPKEKASLFLSDPLYMMKMMDHLYEEYGSARGYFRILGLDDDILDQIVINFTI